MLKLNRKDIVRFIPAIILFFPALSKILGSQEAQFVISQLGFDNNEEFLIGLFELSGVGMLMFRKFASVGAVIACCVLSGAIGAHLTVLGFEGEMGVLFAGAMTGLAFSAYLAWSLRKEIPLVGRLIS